MAISAGFTGIFTVATVTVANITKADLNFKRKLVDVTALASTGAESMFPTTYSVSGTVSGSYDSADTTGQQAMVTALTGATAIAAAFKTAASGANTTWSGSAYLEDAKWAIQPSGVVQFTATLKSTGAWTFA